jgi:hypothetical protein
MEVFTTLISTSATGENTAIQTPAADNGYVGIWSINWDALFGTTKQGQCRVKFTFRSSSFAVGAETNNTLSGTLRANFSSSHASVSNGVCLGIVNPVNDVIDAAKHLIVGDTSETPGVTINIPKYNNILTIRLLRFNGEIPIALTANYEMMLYFEVEPDHLDDRLGAQELMTGHMGKKY